MELTEQQRTWARLAGWTDEQMATVLDVRKALDIDVKGIDSPGTVDDVIAIHEGAKQERQDVHDAVFMVGSGAGDLEDVESALDRFETAIRAPLQARLEAWGTENRRLQTALDEANRRAVRAEEKVEDTRCRWVSFHEGHSFSPNGDTYCGDEAARHDASHGHRFSLTAVCDTAGCEKHRPSIERAQEDRDKYRTALVNIVDAQSGWHEKRAQRYARYILRALSPSTKATPSEDSE